MGCEGARLSCVAMSFNEYFRTRRGFPAWGRVFPPFSVQLAVILVIHFAALVVMAATEIAVLPKVLCLLSWGILNFFWLMVSRRPGVSAALSLAMVVMLILVSRLKHGLLMLTANFVDVMIIDTDTPSFVLRLYPDLRRTLLIAACVAVPLMIWCWRMDPYRIRIRMAAAGAGACLAGLTLLCFANPIAQHEAFFGDSYVSKFMRSGVGAVSELLTHDLLDSDPVVTGALSAPAAAGCRAPAKRPHIIMVLDESSFDISTVAGVKVPPDYRDHFKSFDGKRRSFVVEGAGGPTWYTEYNVLTGLSARSFGHFAYFVPRIAAGRVERGLPRALQRCGYRTFTLYPDAGDFLSARRFQQTVGIDRFVEAHQMGSGDVEPDRFYFDQVRRTIERERGGGPLFIFSYVTANHFPWTTRFRPELTPEWKDPG